MFDQFFLLFRKPQEIYLSPLLAFPFVLFCFFFRLSGHIIRIHHPNLYKAMRRPVHSPQQQQQQRRRCRRRTKKSDLPPSPPKLARRCFELFPYKGDLRSRSQPHYEIVVYFPRR